MAKRIIGNWRYWVLGVLFLAGVLGIANEQEGLDFAWFFITKGIGFTSFYALYRLSKMWYFGGKIPEIKVMVEEEEI